MSTQLGLDKLQLLLPASAVTFRPEFPAIVDKPINAATGEYQHDRFLYSAGDLVVTGRKAYLNHTDFQFSLLPDRESDNPICLVQFSAGAYSSDNLHPITDMDELAELARHVEADLASLGAEMCLSDAKVTRMDIARNVEMSRPVQSYASAFAALSCRKRVDKKDYGGTGFLIGNKSWEVNFYDKGAEMNEKGVELAACPVNTLRPEVRLKKSSIVREAVSCDTFKDISGAWGNFKPAYLHLMERDVFKAKPEANLDRTIALHQLAEFVRKSGAKRTTAAFHKELGMMQLVLLVGAEEAKRFVANEFGYDAHTDSGKRQIARLSAEYDLVNFSLKMHKSTTEGALVKELYRELERAVMNF